MQRPIVKIFLTASAYPTKGPVGLRVVGADPKLKPYPHDPNRAKELLAQAGYAQGCDVRLYYSAGTYQKTEKYVRWWRLRWSKGGFRVELISQEYALHWGPERKVNGGKLPFYYENRGSLTDADTIYDQYFRTGTTEAYQL